MPMIPMPRVLVPLPDGYQLPELLTEFIWDMYLRYNWNPGQITRAIAPDIRPDKPKDYRRHYIASKCTQWKKQMETMCQQVADRNNGLGVVKEEEKVDEPDTEWSRLYED